MNSSTVDFHFCPLAKPDGDHYALAYLESGPPDGEIVLFLHEFALFSRSFDRIAAIMSERFRCICPDCPGFGYSRIPEGCDLSSSAQVEAVAEFIRRLKLERFTIVGHGIGGDIALRLAEIVDIAPRIRRVALLGSEVASEKTPELIANIGSSAMSAPIVRMIHSGFLMRMMLRYGWAPQHVPDSTATALYADMLNQPGRGDSILEAARNFSPSGIPKSVPFPLLVIHGAEDPIVRPELARKLARKLKNADPVILPECGHFIPDEMPAETARILTDWIAGTPAEAPQPPPPEPSSRIRILRLFDRWHFGTLLLIIVLKSLQLLRRLGVGAEKHGWRKLSGIFLKNEYSKFMIATFRLRYLPPDRKAEEYGNARRILVERLRTFIDSKPELHWTVLLAPIAFRNRRLQLCDIMEAEIDRSGALLSITPHFDPRRPVEMDTTPVIRAVIDVYNSLRSVSASQRLIRISKALNRRLRKQFGWDIYWSRGIAVTAERIMTAAFLYFERLPEEGRELEQRRFRTPEPRHRHPGWGLLCIICRFSSDLQEADLWWQFNHVSVDGAPMQDLLTDLKQSWGTAGPLVFPALKGHISLPSTVYCGDRVFRARFFMDFSGLMELRKRLNAKYGAEMNGNISLAGLLMWGIARHPAFTGIKILLPVDWHDSDRMRQLGLLVIRPGTTGRRDGTLQSFLEFAREMNRHLDSIRQGHSETGEFLALCSMLHPALYYAAAKLFPRSLGEVMGTMGISIIRDAEIFITPQTDWQINGFMAIGSTTIPTADGKHAGLVSVSGNRKQIRAFFDALSGIDAALSALAPPPPRN